MMKLDKQMKKIIAGVILGGALAAFTGCSSQIGAYKGDGGYFKATYEGDSMGLDSWNNHYASIINEAKTSANKTSAYYKDKAVTTQTRALRFGMPDWMKNLKKPAAMNPAEGS